jgi:hypothetical protein
LSTDNQLSLESVLDSLINEVRHIDNINFRLYEVSNVDNENKNLIIYSGNELKTKDKVLKQIYDSRTNSKSNGIYLAIEKDTVTGDVFSKKTPCVSISKDLINNEDLANNVHYKTNYHSGRFNPFIKNRAGFPLIIQNQINYIFIVDKEDKDFIRKHEVESIIGLLANKEKEIYNQKVMIYLYGLCF